jgi:hypothetical protein
VGLLSRRGGNGVVDVEGAYHKAMADYENKLGSWNLVLLRILFALATFSGNNVSFADIRLSITTTFERGLFLRDFLIVFFFASDIYQRGIKSTTFFIFLLPILVKTYRLE